MDDLLLQLIVVCTCTFLGGFIDSISGGGGLITLPAYLAIGLPPHLAMGTNKLSSTAGTLTATIRYMRGGKIHLRTAATAGVMALFGAALGAQLNMVLDEEYLRYLLLGVLPVIAFITLKKKKNRGETDEHTLLRPSLLTALSMGIGFVIGTYDGFFGPGTGTFLIFLFTGLTRFDSTTASGNAKVVNLMSNLSSLLTFALAGKVVFVLGLPGALFGVLGNYIGSGLALRYNTKVIRPMLIVSLVLLFCKVAYDIVLPA
ncbi:sulfite exporter TauE/SafE family protein [Faecalispora anaeroviscerum]|uniref:sulfite exporter TauE/SafE family protein n=1 Tax=Faecalispora anaeroviscerum TaxID=2991836 RepID=UPI0024BBE516|nr:TSUP family transporter [Faecalispora anaeroviscerum]